MNHPDTDIADAIIAGMGSADGPTEQMAAIVTSLERAGFEIVQIAQHKALMAAAHKWLDDNRELASAPPDCGCENCRIYAVLCYRRHPDRGRGEVSVEISWNEFERRLIEAGWSQEAAKRERQRQESGDLGDCDGDLEP
jgi:hypothetical protein